jgi:hypothetical protein
LVHGYHDQVLGYDEPRIKTAWKKFCDSGKYKSVLSNRWGMHEHYALNNQMELLAEMTESYFGSNDFYPFVAGELQQAEPEIFALMAEIWGPLPKPEKVAAADPVIKAGEQVTLKGKLKGGLMAIGGETTGWQLEHVGHDPGKIHGTLHSEAYNHTKGTQRSGKLMIPTCTTEFHTYSMDWSADKIVMHVDGMVYATFKKTPGDQDAEWPFHKPFYLILNLAIGGAWGGQKGIDDAAFPQRMEVDFVRVYRKM